MFHMDTAAANKTNNIQIQLCLTYAINATLLVQMHGHITQLKIKTDDL